MANLFLNLPTPAANGAGDAVDVSAMGGTKTVTVTGNGGVFEPTVTIEVCNEADATDAYWAPLWTFTQPGEKTFSVAARFMRASVGNYRGGGAPLVDLGSTDDGTAAAELVATAASGSGAGVDTSALGALRTVQVGGAFGGRVNVEISNDGSTYETVMSFGMAGIQTAVFLAEWMRVTRVGVPGVAPGLPLVNVVACSTGGAAGGVTVQENGLDVEGSPFTTLNFVNANITDGGGGVADITVPTGIDGTGTAGTVPLFIDANTIGDSALSQAVSTIIVADNLTANNALTTLYQLIVQGYFARQSAISPAALAAGTTNDYAPAGMVGAGRIRQATNGAGSSLSGLVTPGVNGNEYVLVNLGPGTLTLLNEDAGSTAANRFVTEGGVNRAIGVNGAVLISYDNALSRWLVVG